MRARPWLWLTLLCWAVPAAAEPDHAPDHAIDPKVSPVLFADETYGGRFPDELLYEQRDGIRTFTAIYAKDEGYTSVIYGQAQSGVFEARGRAPGEVKRFFIPDGSAATAVGEGATVQQGRRYAFERYALRHEGQDYGCFVATAPSEADVVIVNLCRFDAQVPDDAAVVRTLGLLSFADARARET
ncbi:MAG TPA: hypothetical protein VD995_25685 [Azospirillum sp.]|nr:hypothetical protein [Azospirillum sp.]